MNMGTLSGAPKVRAMQLIAAAEGKRRGSYGGAVGYFTAHGDLDTCIVIRSAYVQDGIATVQAGAGIVLIRCLSPKRMKPVIKLARCCAQLLRPTTLRRLSDGRHSAAR
jgi:hypothetical protein